MVFTHLSARVPGPDDHFLTQPLRLPVQRSYCIKFGQIDLDGNVVLDNGFEVNAAGFTIHSAVHMARHDALAVMHVHTDAGVAVASMQEGLLPLSQHAMFVYHDLAYHDWEGVALDLDERERVVADLGSKNVMLLRNRRHPSLGRERSILFSAALLPRTRMQNPARHYEQHPKYAEPTGHRHDATNLQQQRFLGRTHWCCASPSMLPRRSLRSELSILIDREIQSDAKAITVNFDLGSFYDLGSTLLHSNPWQALFCATK